MNESQARAFLKYLSRCEIKGFEIDEFAAVVNHCRSIVVEAELRRTGDGADAQPAG